MCASERAHRASTQLGADYTSTIIGAQYYTIADPYGLPVAGLLILNDSANHPVRAELHLYDDLPSHIQEGALRKARTVLQGAYLSEETLPMRVILTREMRDAVDVDLAESPQLAINGSRRAQAQAPRVAAALTLAILAVVLASVFFARTNPAAVKGVAEAVERVTGIDVQEIAGIPAGEPSDLDANDSSEPELPPSRNARSDLQLGMRVSLAPDLQLTLRSEPGIDAGTVRGYMLQDDAAVIIGGPINLEGNADTIVWWFVRLDDGTEAWAAANTSQATLLIPEE